MVHRRVTAALLLLALAVLPPGAHAAGRPAAKAGKAKPGATAAPAPPAELRLFKEATFLLPASAKVSARWVLPPTEKTHISARLAVDPGGAPLIAVDQRLISPLKGWVLSLSAKPSALTWLPSGVLLLAYGRDVGLLAEPATERTGEKGAPAAAFQPLVSLPLQGIVAMGTAGGELLCVGQDASRGKQSVYRLRSGKGTGLQDLELVYESTEGIGAVTGDEAALYVASGRKVTRVSRRDGAATAWYTHPRDSVEELALTPAGLVVSTGSELILAGPSGAIELMRSTGHRVVMQGSSLYVLFTSSLGVLALDGLGDLARFDLSVRSLRPGEATPALTLSPLRFFESGPPPYGTEEFAEQFDRGKVRGIVARVDYTAAPAKTAQHHVLTVSWFEPTGGQLMSATYPLSLAPRAAAGTLYASIGGQGGGGYQPRRQGSEGLQWKFGNDPLGMRYPGKYRVELEVDGVPAGTGTFTLTGEAVPIQIIAYDDLAALQQRLASGLDVRTRVDGSPLLHLAIRFGTTRAVEAILKAGADPNELDKDGNPPLAICMLYVSDWRAKAELLLRKGANVNGVVGEKKNPLVHSTWNAAHVAFLLRNGADPRSRNAFTGETVFGKVTSPQMCTEELVTALISKGMDINQPATTLEKETPLARAIFYADEPCVALLLSRGASQRGVKEDRGPRTALYVALDHLRYADKPEGRRIVERLLAAGGTLERGERSIMFDRDFATFFDSTTLGVGVLTNDEALQRATGSSDPEIQGLALRAHVARVRELTEAATADFQLDAAHGHCTAAFKLAEAGYPTLELQLPPAGQPSPRDAQGRSALGLTLVRRPERGVYVQGTSPGGAAERAGLRPGDVLLTVDGADVNAPLDAMAALSSGREGRPVRVRFLHDPPGRFPELPLVCGLLEQRIGQRELARMNLGRWLATNPGAPQAAEVRKMLGGT